MKTSQKDRVLKRLRETGKISRNECLRNYISRLSAIMLDLKNEGVDFEAKDVDGDYVYFLKDKPEVINIFVNGEIVKTYKKW